MTTSRKLILATAVGGAMLLTGCVVDPYYDNYGHGYNRGSDHSYYRDRNWRDNDGRWRDNDGRWRDRDDRRDWR
jgi:hypothetical protein